MRNLALVPAVFSSASQFLITPLRPRVHSYILFTFPFPSSFAPPVLFTCSLSTADHSSLHLRLAQPNLRLVRLRLEELLGPLVTWDGHYSKLGGGVESPHSLDAD